MENGLIGANCHNHEIDKQGMVLKKTIGPMEEYKLKQMSSLFELWKIECSTRE